MSTSRWIRNLPAGWCVKRARYLCDIATGSGDTVDAEPYGEYQFIVRSKIPRSATKFDFDCEAVLTAGDGAVGEVFHHLNGKFLAHQRVYVLHNFQHVTARYFYYYFQSFFALMAQDGSARTTVDSVRRWMIADMPFTVPPLVQQAAITDFLDRETTQIDTLIAKQESLIATLRERRVGVAEHILSKYVGAGERLKWIVAEVDDRAGKRVTELPLLSVSISWGVRRRDHVKIHQAASEDLSNYKIVRAGQLVLNRMRAFQGALGVAPEDGIVSPDYAVLRILPGTKSEWLAATMRSPIFVSEMVKRLKGIGSADLGAVRTPRINVADLGDIRIKIPSEVDQTTELNEFSYQASKIDVLIEKAQRFIELTQERRAALITAAVTGQINVRDKVA